jgi:hypothetical protein
MWNPWRENLKDTPKESLNWRLWFGVFGKGIHLAKLRPVTNIFVKSSD